MMNTTGLSRAPCGTLAPAAQNSHELQALATQQTDNLSNAFFKSTCAMSAMATDHNHRLCPCLCGVNAIRSHFHVMVDSFWTHRLPRRSRKVVKQLIGRNSFRLLGCGSSVSARPQRGTKSRRSSGQSTFAPHSAQHSRGGTLEVIDNISAVGTIWARLVRFSPCPRTFSYLPREPQATEFRAPSDPLLFGRGKSGTILHV